MRASKITVQRLFALLVATFLAAPGIGSAQTAIASAPLPDPPPLRLFTETVPKGSGRAIESIKSSSWWAAPAGNSETPRWAIGQTVALNTTGGVALSAGLFGRRADPLPLFLSQGATQGMLRAASRSITHPSTYRLQWDAIFRVTAPLWNDPQLKIDGFGEVFVPLISSTDRPFRPARAVRFGVATGF